ncbi:plasmid partitioning protein RepB C-terminal domain-containing protein [Bradyrhizobium sp. SSUT112]|uniref:ParB/RepB/Spo0J family partition protein n=1 Tax=Bradyrhizobium sp. SSUT112 TaxID=3040604 RepID=UPI00244AD088|nr:plasmid partitioning protein RepB C-terminal domain-containing protein [Bradyrhizobium sp. SSUT112]MDH2352279.1 plasmid partitioning protein RepB C-terminal domain-containing protein [Bradyrhizobium sp. SSUT112]
MKPRRKIESIPIAAIKVLNPRNRSRARFSEIVKSIGMVGLKRPITASKRAMDNGYELACGQTRMEAVSMLGQAEIPAILVDASTKDCILMSLVENIARRRHSPIELVRDIGRLAKTYKAPDIAAKLGVTQDFARAIAYLIKHGEDRLISAVERGIVPPALAVEIARAKTPRLQAALLEAFVSEKHTSKQIEKMRKLVEQQHRKSMKAQLADETINAASLVRAFRQETERQEIVAKKAGLTHARLIFLINALKTLMSERMFTSLLREERLDKLPLPVLRLMSASVS